MANTGPADGGGSKNEEPLFPYASEVAAHEAQCDTQRKYLGTQKALAGAQLGLVFEAGGCVVIRDKHGATVLRITHMEMEDGIPMLKVVPYSAGAPENAWRFVLCDV